LIYLQCTKVVRRILGAADENLREAPTAESVLGNWSVNYVPVGSRNALVFMSDRTLLSFPILEGKQAFEMQDMPSFLGHGLSQLMQMTEVPKERYAGLLEDTNVVALTKPGSQSILGLHRSISSDYDFRVERAGGISKCDLGIIIAAVNQTPRAKLDFATSFEVTNALLIPGGA